MASLLLLLLVPWWLRAGPDETPVTRVPFGCGRSFLVSQGHQVGSHREHDAYAWDFRMPKGEPIVAALDGVVRLARGDSTAGGCDPSYARDANYVVVSHGDGIETQYLHFSKVVVAQGDVVRAGDLLGYSGDTGWACGPHLHFKVARTSSQGWNNPSIPARLQGHGDPQAGILVSSASCHSERPYLASLFSEEALLDGGVSVGAGPPPPALFGPGHR